MARTRKGVIHEPLYDIQVLERTYANHAFNARVRMLRCLKESPSLSFQEIALRVGASDRQVRRWWEVYRDRGIAGLLPDTRPLDGEPCSTIKPTKKNAGIGGSAVHGIVGSRTEPKALIDSDSVINVLNNVPVTADTHLWGQQFGKLLCGLFDDIDHVVVNVRITARIIGTAGGWATLTLRQHIFTHNHDRATGPVDSVPQEIEDNIFVELIAEGRRQNFPFENYHLPMGFDYRRRGSYLGSILILRESRHSPISSETVSAITSLEPFIANAMLSHIALRRVEHPGDSVFRDLVTTIAAESGLTSREIRVLSLQMLGYSYAECASLLHVSVRTIEAHLRTLHQKTGTRRLGEIFAKYFTPRFWSDIAEFNL